jgi:hypothetical protein
MLPMVGVPATISSDPAYRSMGRCSEFPLARRLPSTASANSSRSVSDAPGSPSTVLTCPPLLLFGNFVGTTRLSDFPWSFIGGLGPQTSPHGPSRHVWRAATGSPDSRVRCVCACRGSATARGLAASRPSETASVAFRFWKQRRPLGLVRFRGSIARLHFPLSTLHPCPYGQTHMTRGQRDWLGLHCTTLSFATPHRFIPALLPTRLNTEPPSKRSSKRFP